MPKTNLSSLQAGKKNFIDQPWKIWNTSHEKGRFLQPIVFDLPVSVSSKPRPLCLTKSVGVLLWGAFTKQSCWIGEWFNWFYLETHSNGIRALSRSSHFMTLQWVFHFYLSYPLLATASTHGELALTVYRITLFIDIKLSKVKVWELLVMVSDWKNTFTQYTDKL